MKSSPTLDTLPSQRQSYPEVCLAGPVNGGKSSIIQAICGSETIARASKKTGNTSTIRFCCVGDAFMIADTAGYGHWMKGGYFLSRSARICSHAFVRQYIASRVNLKKVYLVLDGSKRPCMTCRDKEYYAWLSYERIPFTTVLSKIDKLRPTEIQRAHRKINAEMDAIDRDMKIAKEEIIPRSFLEISSKNGHGIQRLMMDMVYSVTGELTDDQLSLKELQRLSYTPLTTAEQLAIEARYTPAAHNLPDSDDEPYAEWILGTGDMDLPHSSKLPAQISSFYSSLDKKELPDSKSPNSCVRAGANDELHNAIIGVHRRNKNVRSSSEEVELEMPNVERYLSFVPGTMEKYVCDYIEPSSQQNNCATLSGSKFFEERKTLSKNQRNKPFVDKYVRRMHDPKSVRVSARLNFPFMPSPQLSIGGARVMPGLKQGEHSHTFGPATLQRRTRHR